MRLHAKKKHNRGSRLCCRHSIALLEAVQAPLGLVFWLIEQRKVRLQDRTANDRSDQ